MRKAMASVGLAALLSMGIGTAAVAQTNSVSAGQTQVEAETDDDGFFEGDKLGLLGLVGLLGLLGLARGGGGKAPKANSPYSPARGKAPKAKRSKGGGTTDWSQR